MTSRLYKFFFFNDTATTEIYTLSLHDALPIFAAKTSGILEDPGDGAAHLLGHGDEITPDRKSTRLNSSHLVISYAVFCLKKKKQCYHPNLVTATLIRRRLMLAQIH